MTAEVESIRIDTDAFRGTILKVTCKPCDWAAGNFFLAGSGGMALAESAQAMHNETVHRDGSPVTAPDMESIIAAALNKHYGTRPYRDSDLECACGEEWPGVFDGTAALAAHQARAVLAAISEAGAVEWGIKHGDRQVWRRKSKLSATTQITLMDDGELVSRITGPWTAVEGP